MNQPEGSGMSEILLSSELLRLRDVSVRFPGQTLPTLQEISLSIHPRDFVSIVGPSGCGKSTLLRVLAGLLTAHSGQRLLQPAVKTEDRLDLPGHIAMVFQESRLLPWRTVIENIRLPFQLTGQSADEARIQELLHLIGLKPEDHHKFPRMLSGGMKMRVALARALILQPKLILLDEPFAAVDDLLREQLNEELLQLQQRFGFAAVLVTHHLGEAAFLGRRLLMMSANPGRIVAEVPLPWPEPRTAELRADLEFARLCAELKQQLRTAS